MAGIIKFIGVAEMIVGVILGIYIWSEIYISLAIGVIISSLVTGFILLGFAELIELMQKNFDTTNDLVELVKKNKDDDPGNNEQLSKAFKNLSSSDDMTTIGRNKFSGKNLKSVDIPENVTSIGQSAFVDNNLTEVTIPDSVKRIGSRAFRNNNLTKITIGSGVDIASWDDTMGYNEGFKGFYDSNGKQKGTYTWNGSSWELDSK